MRVKRCIHDIVYDLLLILSNEPWGARKTKLCTGANLPLDRCTGFLGLLIDRGLVYTRIRDDGAAFYYISDRGYAYLGLYTQLKRILGMG